MNLFIDADDDCTPQGDLSYSYAVENGNGLVIKSGNTNNASDAFNNGEYTITWTVSDGCGNEMTCTHEFEVVDAKKPTPVCINGIATVIMPSSGTVTLWASDFESGSSFDNCTDYDDLQISFSSDVNHTSHEFTCADIPANGNATAVEIWVTDEEGNQDFCVTYVLLQGNCGPGAMIAGVVQTEDGEDVQDVNMELPGTGMSPYPTGTNGGYAFPSVPTNSSYTVTAEKDINWTNGVTTFDLVLISSHVLGNVMLDSPYKMIAADANKSGTITTFDIVLLRQLILQITTELPMNTSWTVSYTHLTLPTKA